MELARLVAPDGKVVAFDIDEVKIGIARAEAQAQQIPNVEFQVADLEEGGLPQGFDFALTRFVLQHLRDPEALLAKIRTALKPGGIIVVVDTNFRGIFSHPEAPAVERYIEIYSETLRRRHGDADIGLRLPELLVQAGFEGVHVDVVQHAGTSGDAKLITPMTLESIADAAVAEGVESRTEIDSLVAELYGFANNPSTLLSGPRVIEAWALRV